MSGAAEALDARPIAVARSYTELQHAVRQRVAELKLTHLEIDDAIGWASGYAGKLLGPKQVKVFGPRSTGELLDALGLQLVVVEDPENTKWRERLRAHMGRTGGHRVDRRLKVKDAK